MAWIVDAIKALLTIRVALIVVFTIPLFVLFLGHVGHEIAHVDSRYFPFLVMLFSLSVVTVGVYLAEKACGFVYGIFTQYKSDRAAQEKKEKFKSKAEEILPALPREQITLMLMLYFAGQLRLFRDDENIIFLKLNGYLSEMQVVSSREAIYALNAAIKDVLVEYSPHYFRQVHEYEISDMQRTFVGLFFSDSKLPDDRKQDGAFDLCWAGKRMVELSAAHYSDEGGQSLAFQLHPLYVIYLQQEVYRRPINRDTVSLPKF